MPTDTHDIEQFLNKLLQNNSIRKGGISRVEKLVVESISAKMTYQQASIKHQYTESSFQNAASRLFKDLSLVVGIPVNRQNILNLIEKEKHTAHQKNNTEDTFIERINASFWVKSERAQFISISYQAARSLDLTEYLVKYSPNFKTTCCADVEHNVPALVTLLNLCNWLQIPIPSPSNDIQTLLRSIKLSLQKRSVLLVLRFDQSTEVRPQWGDYIDIITTLGNIGNGTCLLVLHKELECNIADTKKSLDYQVKLAFNNLAGIQKAELIDKDHSARPRLLSINNNKQIICTLMHTYMK
jgi:hypothetical protein